MRYIGIDYGTKHVGVAMSDVGGGFAFPREALANDARLVAVLSELAAREGAGAFVVGDTRAASGEENAVTAESDSFCEKLARESGMPAHRVREAWSSAEAMRFAPPGRRHDDSAAAAIILQRYLDGLRTKQ